MKTLIFLTTLFQLYLSQTKMRRFFLDASKNEGSREDPYHKMDQMQVWDQIDLHFIEYPDTGLTWIVDPSIHWDDGSFSVKENRVV